MKQCEFCGKTTGQIAGKNGKFGMDLCRRHYVQMQTHGEIQEITRYDPNKFTVNGDVVEITIYNRCHIEIGKALVDIGNLDIVGKYKWCLNNKGYVQTRINGKTTKLHRLITDCPDNMLVDHRNHCKLDNRLENLRICTNSENGCNQVTSRKNSSGYKGVVWHKATNKWQATISIKGKRIYLGLFTNIEAAIDAREKANVKYQGEFAYQTKEAE